MTNKHAIFSIYITTSMVSMSIRTPLWRMIESVSLHATYFGVYVNTGGAHEAISILK
jgi:ABC-type glycerol-3-phosphate transport system permease component